MKQNLSPHWTSTGSPQEEPSPVETEFNSPNTQASVQESAAHRIPVRRGMPKGVIVTLGISISITGASFLGYLFLEGVGSLQANITGEMIPDHVIELSERGFTDVSVSVGELLEFRNTLATVEQYRSEIPNEKTGMPLLATPTIPPGETVRLRVPSEAAGKEILLISGFDPSRRGMMRVGVRAGAGSFSSSEPEGQIEKQEKEKEEEMDVPLPMLSQKPSSSSSSSAASVPSVPSLKPATVHPVPPTTPTPVVPSVIPPVNTQPEILNLGASSVSQNMANVWPAHLRTNRYTIGSPYVPDLSPIVAVRFGGTHNAAKDQVPAGGTLKGVHRAPDTGPSLWVLVALSFCVMPVYLVRRKVV